MTRSLQVVISVIISVDCSMTFDAHNYPFKVDVDLAKIQAQKPPEDDEVLRKKLWLRIARHVVEEEGDVKK